MQEEMARARDELELRLVSARRALLNELRGEYEALIKKTSPALLRLPILALQAAGRRPAPQAPLPSLAGIADRAPPPRPGPLRGVPVRKVIREASVIGQSMILCDTEPLLAPAPRLGPRGRRQALRPSFAISIMDNSILIDKVDIHSKGPDVVGNIIKDIQQVLKRHYQS